MSREEKMGGAVFVKTQAPSRIPLVISMSKAEAISLKALGTTAGLKKLKPERELAFHCVTLAQWRQRFVSVFSPLIAFLMPGTMPGT